MVHSGEATGGARRDACDFATEVETLKRRLAALEAGGSATAARSRMRGRTRLETLSAVAVATVIAVLAGASIVYGQSAVEALFIGQNGNVGIGTTAPNAQLSFGTTLNDNKLALWDGAGDKYGFGIRGGQLMVYSGAGGTITFGNFDGSNFSEKMRVRNDGNVGIGTTNPSYKLAVQGRIADQSGPVMPVGTIVAFGGANPPGGWILCDGRAINEPAYADLRAALGRANVPDLRGRTLIGSGASAQFGTNYSLNQMLGEERHTMSINEMPAHNHGGFGEGYANYWPYGTRTTNHRKGSKGGVDEDNFLYNTTTDGGGQPFNIMQPSYVVNYIIKY